MPKKRSLKYSKLKKLISEYNSAAIAFSGGVDSTMLARVARDCIAGKLLLITASSLAYPKSEFEEAKKIASDLGIEQRTIYFEEIDVQGFSDNPPDRCYYCKFELFSIINKIAKEENCEVVFDGTNFDDNDDYRPGRKALVELGVRSPLNEAELTKNEIREISTELNLKTAIKPSFACLASRFPYGEKITRDKLLRVDEAENQIRMMGFTQFRVRSHQDLARIEFLEAEIAKAWDKRSELESICKNAGYIYVAVDTSGYRMGAMNETLNL